MVDVLNTARLRHERRRTNLLRSAMPQTNAIFRKLASLVPTGNTCRVISVPTACREAGLTEDDLATVFGPGGAAVLGEWSVRYLPDAGRITFARRSLPSSTSARPTPTPNAVTEFDPIEIGQSARRLCEQSWAAGGELTATQAVTKILQERGFHR